MAMRGFGKATVCYAIDRMRTELVSKNLCCTTLVTFDSFFEILPIPSQVSGECVFERSCGVLTMHLNFSRTFAGCVIDYSIR